MANLILHKGKTITIVDLSNKSTPQIVDALGAAQKQISAMPPKSARILTDNTNAEVNKEVVGAILQFAKANTPYVKYSAAVGAEKLKNVILTNISTAVGREIKNFNTRTEALDWLAAQP